MCCNQRRFVVADARERSYVGVSTLYLVATDHGTITVYVQNTETGVQPAAPGEAVSLSFGPEAAFVVDSPEEEAH